MSNEKQYRECHNESCPLPATHAVMWADGVKYFCRFCANKMVAIGDAMGFPVPRQTAREMTPDEMLLDRPVEDAADALVEFFKEMGIPTTRDEAITGTRKWVKLFDGNYDKLYDYHALWTALAKAIVDEGDL